MATAQEYTNEQLNYFRVCYLTTDIIAGGLRKIFKQEWDSRCMTPPGEWKDEPKDGLDFKNRESPRKRKEKARLLATMVKGNRAEWDCTMLFYAILFSDCIGNGLDPTKRSKVDDLRKFRNEDFAHMPHGHLTDAEFQNAIAKVDVAFQALGLSTGQIQVIRNQPYFPTEELKIVLKKVEDLKKEVEVLEAQLNREISSFCVLPPKPSHEVADRESEVAGITKQLEELKEANENRLCYLYISGNPGSGKSQLAGLVAKRYSDVVHSISNSTLFVMTVNAESPSTLLESYVFLARKLKCSEYAITDTLNLPHLKSEEKIAHLKSLIGTKVELYTTWLLVVDNVKSIPKIHAYLPESGNEQWARGLLLITTQDSESVPSMSPCVSHVSVSKGMKPHDAVHLLEKVSGISDCKTEEVARELDYQPLTLARAAAYVREVGDIKGGGNSGWSEYFEKLKEGRINASDTIIVDPVYPKSMGEVTRLAVKEAIDSTNVIIKYVFTLLFFCAPQPLSLEIVTNYIRNVAEEMGDKDDISVKIQRCSLILSYPEKNAFFIRIHQVVHDAIRAVLKDYLKYDKLGAMKAAFKSFYQFVEDTQRDYLSFLDTFAKHSQCIPHIESLTTQIKDIFSVEETRNAVEITFKSDAHYLDTLGAICLEHFADQAAEDCFDIFLKIRPKNLRPDDLDVGIAYNCLGVAQIKLQEHEKAKESLNSALQIFLKELRPGNVVIGVTYSSLGDVHQFLCNFIHAKEYYHRALSIFQKELKPDNYIVGKTYSNLGNVLKVLGELNQAKESYDRALPILRKEFGPEHADVGMTYKKLGDVHQNLSDLIKAKEYYNLALHILLKVFGPEDDDVGMTYKKLGDVHQNLSDLTKAKEYYNLALPILQKELGPESYVVGKTLMELGNVHRDLDKLNHQNLSDLIKAKEYYKLALHILLKVSGPEDDDVGMTYKNLGDVHQNLSDLTKAKEYYKLALHILLKVSGPEDDDVGMTYKKLGDVHQNLSDLTKAKEYYNLALPILQKELGPESYVVGKTLMELGKVLRDLGELSQAKESYELALLILLRELGPEGCLIKMIKVSLVKIKQLQENFPRSSGSFGKRPNCSGHLGLVLAKRSKKK